ncbi:MAG: DUF4234 domain-containing protein [Clostridia bacterium]|nr:DUF4234 domain-containing protein [Clostridia bacterium]
MERKNLKTPVTAVVFYSIVTLLSLISYISGVIGNIGGGYILYAFVNLIFMAAFIVPNIILIISMLRKKADNTIPFILTLIAGISFGAFASSVLYYVCDIVVDKVPIGQMLEHIIRDIPSFTSILIEFVFAIIYAVFAYLIVMFPNSKFKKFWFVAGILKIVEFLVSFVFLENIFWRIVYFISERFFDYSFSIYHTSLLGVIMEIAMIFAFFSIFAFLANPEKKAKKLPSNIQDGELYKNIVVHIVLSLVTCGIYTLIWYYKTTEKLNALSETKRNSTVELLLCMFVPFYWFYWTYKTAKITDELLTAKGKRSDNAILYTLLGIVLNVLPSVLLQLSFNELAKKEEGAEEPEPEPVTEEPAEPTEEELAEERAKALERTNKYRVSAAKALIIGMVIAVALAFIDVGSFYVQYNVIKPYNDYKAAKRLMEDKDFTQAKKEFQWLDGYKDSEELITECDYQLALIEFEEKDFSSAKTAFEVLGDYKDSKEKLALCEAEILKAKQKEAYENAVSSFGKYGYTTVDRAISCFKGIPDGIGNVDKVRKALNVLKSVEKWKDPDGFGMQIGVYGTDKNINFYLTCNNGPDKRLASEFKVTVDALCADYPIVIKNADTTITITADSLTYDYANADPAFAITGKIFNQFQ